MHSTRIEPFFIYKKRQSTSMIPLFDGIQWFERFESHKVIIFTINIMFGAHTNENFLIILCELQQKEKTCMQKMKQQFPSSRIEPFNMMKNENLEQWLLC